MYELYMMPLVCHVFISAWVFPKTCKPGHVAILNVGVNVRVCVVVVCLVMLGTLPPAQSQLEEAPALHNPCIG